MNIRMNISFAFLGLLVACSAGPTPVASSGGPGPGLPPVESASEPVPATAATPGPTRTASPAASFVGVVTTRQSKVVVAQFEGRLDALLVHAGQPVHVGDAIARLDASQLQKQVEVIRGQEAAARAAASAAGIERREARRLLALERRLVKADASTAEAVRGATANVSRSGASSAQAYNAYTAVAAERARIEELLAHATLTSPIDGVVSMIRLKEGELAVPGTPIARIFDPSDRWIRFAIPDQSGEAAFAVGSKVEVTVPSAVKNTPPVVLVATVATVSSVMEPPLQLVVVEADLDDTRPETALAEVGKTVDVRRLP
jgi:multidrug efflux system membrane fusion protein